MRLANKGLTPAQQKVLDFIASSPMFPTAREISDHMGWKNTSGAHETLRKLEWRGMIGRADNGERRVLGGATTP